MLFAGWEVRIVKNCDRGLENAARRRRPWAAFSSPRSLHGPTLSRQITCLFFFLQQIDFADYKLVCLSSFVIESACAPSTNDLQKTLRNEGVTQIVDKEKCIKVEVFFRTTLCLRPLFHQLSSPKLFLQCEISCEV